jgi:hypothetical protein
MLDHLRSWYGPAKVAFERLDEHSQVQLAADLVDVYRRHNEADDGTLVLTSDYVEVVAVVR